MIRIAHTSDLHIDERHRIEDTVMVLDAFLEQAREADVDVIVVAGDHFERRSTPKERNVLAVFLQEAARFCPVVCVKGNHDAQEDLDIFALLETSHPVLVFSRPTATPDSAVLIPTRSGRDLAILALPWFDKANLVRDLEATVDADQTREITISVARDLLTCIRAEGQRARSVGGTPILVGHVLVGGSEVASGQTLIGTTVELAPSDLLDVGAEYSALGHVHMNQQWFNGRVAYSGSPNRCNFGEPEPKGWRLVTIDDKGKFKSNEFRELPARRMVLLRADVGPDDPDAIAVRNLEALYSDGSLRGALVRLRIYVKAEDLHLIEEDVIVAALRRCGAFDVKVEAIVETQTRIRSEEILRVQSTPEKLLAFWKAKQIEVDEPTRTRVLARLAELEAA